MNTTLSLRIYKNEIAADRLSFIHKSFKVAEEQHRRRAGRKATNKEIFYLYIGIIAPNEKYLKKS